MAAPDGVLVVDKPSGWTSHDVVARCRRLAETRKVGHAGTLDPMATGVLVLGIGRATRLLGYLSAASKTYLATVRLGLATVTDDAAGEPLASVDASGVSDEAVEQALVGLRGDILQSPSAVSAIKVDGQRAYARVRAGDDVELAARPVRVDRLEVLATRRDGGFVDLDVVVDCSSGTYVRALARDLGRSLEVGGHLTALRRTRVGSFGIDAAQTIDELAALAEQASEGLPILSLSDVATATFAVHEVADDQVAAVRNGRALQATLPLSSSPSAAVAVVGPDGAFLALYAQDGPVAKALAVFAPA